MTVKDIKGHLNDQFYQAYETKWCTSVASIYEKITYTV